MRVVEIIADLNVEDNEEARVRAPAAFPIDEYRPHAFAVDALGR